MTDRTCRVFALVVGVTILATGLGGCTGPKYDEVTGATFNQQVLQSSQPVLVAFYKEACPTCGMSEGVLNQLKGEYGDRVKFVRLLAMTAAFQKPAPELSAQFGLERFPTVILFLGGRERYRWTQDYNIEDYRKGLDSLVPKSTAATGKS
jgi:thioredoxin 1